MFLGATPDAKLCDESGKRGIAEIKCPYCARNCTIREACSKHDFCLEIIEETNEISLKRNRVLCSSAGATHDNWTRFL